MFETLESRNLFSVPSSLAIPTDVNCIMRYDGRYKGGDQIVAFSDCYASSNGGMLPYDQVNCGGQGQHLKLSVVVADTGAQSIQLSNLDNGKVILQWSNDSEEMVIINGGNGADTILIDGTNGNLGYSSLVFNGDNGQDAMTINGWTPGTTTFNGDAGKDTMNVANDSGVTIFNGGGGNDTANGQITVVDIGGKT